MPIKITVKDATPYMRAYATLRDGNDHKHEIAIDNDELIDLMPQLHELCKKWNIPE
jgi:hypothetical protein